MDQETLGSIVLLAIVTLLSVVQNASFANKVEHESRHCNGKVLLRQGSSSFDRVYTAKGGFQSASAPAAFAGLMYLFVRQKYFVGYLGERTQSTPGYLFGKRIILFLFLMSVAGILNYYLIFFFGSDFEIHIKTITSAISPLLLIP
ncbi:Arachidonate 5-lipoxygenase-activating protein [Lonchura striata]|uniref:Arachidonate 5-lipoxygenase-activating protein n=1 Tax=Lonchura striata TaxID=40157 RepID=A0A218V6M4_9PASE|nr:Arachidonate 5-lipoxygenase-activating protein [Lonchura striata domestica]